MTNSTQPEGPSYEDLFKFWAQQGKPEIIDTGKFEIKVDTVWTEDDVLDRFNGLQPIPESEGGPWSIDDNVAVRNLPNLFRGLGVYDFKLWQLTGQINRFRTIQSSNPADVDSETLRAQLDQFFLEVSITLKRT